jgi:hypothetical protein
MDAALVPGANPQSPGNPEQEPAGVPLYARVHDEHARLCVLVES